jgi:micrococcal nuclease
VTRRPCRAGRLPGHHCRCATQAAAESAFVATPPPGSSSEAETLQGLPTALVSRVIDGDTVELGDGSRVRYIGMDTPESS